MHAIRLHIGLLDPFLGECERLRGKSRLPDHSQLVRGAQGVPLATVNGSGSRDQTSAEFGRSDAPKRALSLVKHGPKGASRRHAFSAAFAILSRRDMELRVLAPHPPYHPSHAAFSLHAA